MDISFIPPEILNHHHAVVASANWYQFGLDERVHNPQVESRMLLWCEAGTGRVRVNGEWWSLNVDDFLLLPWRHEIVYEADASNPFLVGGIHIIPHHNIGTPMVFAASHRANDDLSGLQDRHDVSWPELEGLIHGSFVWANRLRLLAHYAVESHSQTPLERAARDLARLLIEELWRAVAERRAGATPLPHELRRLQEYVRLHLDQNVQTAQLEGVSGLSSATIHRLFLHFTGMPPQRWIAALRSEVAQRLLRTTAIPVAEVGRRVGLNDPFHFSRFFRRQSGLSPQMYRECNRKI
jgi:AraC-like DNA-binding protein